MAVRNSATTEAGAVKVISESASSHSGRAHICHAGSASEAPAGGGGTGDTPSRPQSAHSTSSLSRRTVTSRARLTQAAAGSSGGLIKAGELTIDPDTYAAKLKGRPLDLTYKEFELLKFLSQHPGRVFTRDQLLREVWGYDYFGGTRTVDVHVRRLRAKLGSEYESMIGTVRQVGYKFVVPPSRALPDSEPIPITV